MKRPFRAAVSGKRLISETIGGRILYAGCCICIPSCGTAVDCDGLGTCDIFCKSCREGKIKERVNLKYEKEQKSGDRLQRRCRGLFWNRQLRSFLPRPDGAWLDFCCLALAQLGLAVMNIIILKNRSKPKVVGGKVYESEGFGRNRPSE